MELLKHDRIEQELVRENLTAILCEYKHLVGEFSRKSKQYHELIVLNMADLDQYNKHYSFILSLGDALSIMAGLIDREMGQHFTELQKLR